MMDQVKSEALSQRDEDIASSRYRADLELIARVATEEYQRGYDKHYLMLAEMAKEALINA